jgi:hypothetical protein
MSFLVVEEDFLDEDLRSLCAKLGAATVLMLAAGVLHAQDGLEGAVVRLNRAASFAQPVTALSGPTLAAADFDGDNKPDGAAHGQCLELSN